MTLNKQIGITFVVLIVSIIFFGLNDSIDTSIEDLFYNFQQHHFILDSDLQPYRFIFYDGIKKLLIIFALIVLFVLIKFWKSKKIKIYKKGLIVILLSVVFIPLTVSFLKDITNMPCPEDELHYGGDYIKTAVWECYSDDFQLKNDRIKCWPAGHASGGFALMSLFFLFKRKRNRYIALGTSLVIAWSMGIYKMLIGDHFFSHTVITMVLAWFIILLIVKLVNKFSRD